MFTITKCQKKVSTKLFLILYESFLLIKVDYSCVNWLYRHTSLSRYFLKRSNLASEMIEVAFILIALGGSSTTFLPLSFLLSACNLLSIFKNVSTTWFSLSNLLRLLQPPFYRVYVQGRGVIWV